MSTRSEFLTFGRRLHGALRHGIEDGDGRTDDEWVNVERLLFEHHSCGMYLAGCLAYPESKYGLHPWNIENASDETFDAFINSLAIKI